MHSGRLKRVENVKRGRGITKELAMDRGALKLAIHVQEPAAAAEPFRFSFCSVPYAHEFFSNFFP